LFNIYVMTSVLLQDILAQIRLKMSALLKVRYILCLHIARLSRNKYTVLLQLNESLAILDLITSFASIIVTSAGQQQFGTPCS
jgi:hypothetical protein